jgi:hypothetical protein
MNDEYPEKDESLWLLAASPAIWAAHFLVSYATAAIWCAKIAGPDGSLSGARVAIAAYTAVALAGIGVVGWRAIVRARAAGSSAPLDADSPVSRHRFIGFATVLLSGLSCVAVLFEALAVVFIRSCS